MPRSKIPWPLRVLAATAATALLVSVGTLALLSRDGVATGLTRAVLGRVVPDGVALTVGQVPRLGWRGLTATDVALEAPDLGVRARLDTVRADYRLSSWRWGRIVLSQLDLVGVAAEVEADGIARDSTEADVERAPDGEPWTVLLEAVELRSSAVPGPGGSVAAGPRSDGTRAGVDEPAGSGAADPTTDSSFRVGQLSGALRGVRVLPELGAESWALELAFAPAGQPEWWGAVSARGSLAGRELLLDTLSILSPRSQVAGRVRLALDSSWSQPGGLDWRLEATPLALGDLEGLVAVPGVLAGDSLTLTSWSEAEEDSAAVYLQAETTAGASLTTELRWRRVGPGFGYRGEARVLELDIRRYLGDAVPVGPTSGTALLAGRVDWQNGEVSALESALDVAAAAAEGELRLDGRVARGSGADGTPSDTLDLRVQRLRWGDEIDGSGTIRAVRSAAQVDWRADLKPREGGRLSASGGIADLSAEGGPRWSADVQLDAVPEPRSGSVITGRGRVEGTGPLPGTFSLSLAPSTLAGWSVDTATVGWTQGLEDVVETEGGPGEPVAGSEGPAAGRVRASAEGDFGALTLDADLSVREEGGRLAVRSLELDSLGWPGAREGVSKSPESPAEGDPTQDESPPAWMATRLDGELAGALSWEGPISEASDPARWSGDVAALLRGVSGPDPALVVDSVQAELRLQGGTVDGRLEGGLPGAGRVSVAIAGAVTPPWNLRIPWGRFQGIDLSAFLASAPATRLDGTVSGEVRGSTQGTQPTVQGRIELDPSTVREGRIEALTVELLLGPGEIRGDVVAELAGGSVRGRVDGPSGWREAGWGATAWRLDADAALPELGAFFGLPDTAVAVAGRLEVQGHPESGTRVDLGLWETRGWEGRIDTAVVRGELTGSLLTVDTVLVRSNLGVADGSGAVPRVVLGLPSAVPPVAVEGAVGPSTLALTVAIPDSAAALQLGPRTRVQAAGGTADLEATCRNNECALHGEVELHTALVGPWSVLSFQAGLDGSVGPGRSFGPTRTGVLAEGIRAPRLDVRTATFQSQWNGTDLELAGSALIDDRRTAVAELTIDPGARAVAFQRLDLRFDEDRWSLERPVTFRSDSSGVSLDSLVFTAEPQRIVAGIGEEDGVRYLSVTADSIRLDAFTDLLGRPDVGGSASGRLRLRGAEEALVLTGALTADVTEEGRRSHRIELEAEAGQGEFSGDLVVQDAEGLPRITGHTEGRVPGTGDGQWTGTVDLDVPMEWAGLYAPPEWIRDATGSLQGQLSITGDPEGIGGVEGPLELISGQFEVPRAEIVLEEIQVDASLEGRTLRLNSARAASRGSLTLEGSVSLPTDGGVPEIDLRATADDFLASNSRELELAVSGEVATIGTLEVPRIEGQLQVGQASYRIPAVLGRQLREVTLTDEDWAILQSRFGIIRPDEEGERWFPRSALLDLDISLGRNIWLRRDANPELALQFTGEMQIVKGAEDQAIQLRGNVESIPGRSYVEEFGRRFTLEEGVVTFRGPVSRTLLQVAAEYKVPTSPDEDPVTIRLDVTGGLDELELALSSEPSLSNGDIVSYLATGRPTSSAFSGDGSGSLGADILATRLSGSLEQIAQEEVGLDVLQIQQDGLQGTSLVAGKYVNPRLFLGFRQGVTFQADDGRSFTEGLNSQAEVEYTALDWLVLNVQGGTSAIRFFLEATYGW